MIIRLADLEKDALGIMDCARAFARAAPFQSLLPDDEGLLKAISMVLTLDGTEVLVADVDGEVVGGLGVLYAPFTWNQDVLIADELFWWAQPHAPFRAASRLLETAVERAEAKGAVPIFHSMASSPDSVTRAYARFGLLPSETTYMRAA